MVLCFPIYPKNDCLARVGSVSFANDFSAIFSRDWVDSHATVEYIDSWNIANNKRMTVGHYVSWFAER